MNINANKAKGRSSQTGSKIFGLILAAVLVGLVIVIEFAFNMQKTATVEVLGFNSDVYKDTLVTEDMMEKITMLQSEYEKSGEMDIQGTTKRQIVLWDDRYTLLEQPVYVQYYTHSFTPIFWYGVQPQTTTKNSYLYTMDGELLKLDISADLFGDFIVPGDKINVRQVYTENKYYLPSVSEYAAMQNTETGAGSVTVTKTELLFSNATILDMMNGNGSSIYDVWYQWLALPTAEQKDALYDESFKEATAPSTILMCVTSEEVERYMELSSKGGQLTITLLPRDTSNVILEAMDSLNYAY